MFDVSHRAWGRQKQLLARREPVLLDSDLPKRSCRTRTRPEPSRQEAHDDSPHRRVDPHQDQFNVGIVDPNGVPIEHRSFPDTGKGYIDAIEMLTTHRVELVGVEGSAGWGRHVSIALAAAGFDAREVPAQRMVAQRRARRLDKTDHNDAISTARALLAEPSLGPVQALEVYDPLVAKIEAVLEHRRALVAARTLLLHHVGDQLAKLPNEIRDQLGTSGKIEARLRHLETVDLTTVSTMAGHYRLSCRVPLIDHDRHTRAEIRRLERVIDDLLDEHGTTLRDEPGIGTITGAWASPRIVEGSLLMVSVDLWGHAALVGSACLACLSARTCS